MFKPHSGVTHLKTHAPESHRLPHYAHQPGHNLAVGRATISTRTRNMEVCGTPEETER